MQLRSQAKHCLLQHDFEKARALLTEALRLTPDSYKLYRLRSVALACMQQYQEALAVRPAVPCSMLCSCSWDCSSALQCAPPLRTYCAALTCTLRSVLVVLQCLAARLHLIMAMLIHPDCCGSLTQCLLLQDADQVIAAMPGSTDGYYHRGFALYHLQQYAGKIWGGCGHVLHAVLWCILV